MKSSATTSWPAKLRKVLDYYQDLVHEIKLDARVDGSNDVGHKEPFGVFVDIRHTKEIERESGGFGRYLQNQNNQYWSYNFGRPAENYRDKFSEAATKALEEHFEVLSVTFENPEVNSKALPEYGWRVTPYAYLLLKAKGPQVDKLPPLKLNLDFLDTSGYAVIPVESPALGIDAHPEKAPARPVEDISITQTLDERQADAGKLILEVKATAHGLVPALDELVAVKPAEFNVAKTDDKGVSVVEFDKKADKTCITSQREWTITFTAMPNLTERPKSFQYPTGKVPLKEMVYQRYQDADLVPAAATISLEQRYGNPRRMWLWLGLATLAVLACGVVALVSWKRTRKPAPAPKFQMPQSVTPFTVLGLLRDIQHNNGLSAQSLSELNDAINRLETHDFERPDPSAPDLENIARTWLGQVTRKTASGVERHIS